MQHEINFIAAETSHQHNLPTISLLKSQQESPSERNIILVTTNVEPTDCATRSGRQATS